MHEGFQDVSVCRYQIKYDVSDSNERAAPPLVLDIIFAESAIFTRSILLIGQAASSSQAQQIAVALSNSSSASNAAFTAVVSSTVQSWVADNTSAYVSQLTTGAGSDAATVAAIDSVRLALFGDVASPDVQVLTAFVDQTITALVNRDSTAAVQRYAYNVTLQVTVLTANLLSSVFVNTLNATASYSRRRLLSPKAHHSHLQHSMVLSTELYHSSDSDVALVRQHNIISNLPAAAGFQRSDSSMSMAAGRAVAAAASMVTGTGFERTDSTCMVAGVQHENSIYTPPTCQHGSSPAQTLVFDQDYSSGTAAADQQNDSPGTSFELQHIPQIVYVHQHSSLYSRDISSSRDSASGRKLQASQSSSTFPLVSLLLFKMDLTLAAVQGIAGCSMTNIRDLFYAGVAVPSTLQQLCSSSNGDYSLNQALLKAADSSVPLFQVCLILPGVILPVVSFRVAYDD